MTSPGRQCLACTSPCWPAVPLNLLPSFPLGPRSFLPTSLDHFQNILTLLASLVATTALGMPEPGAGPDLPHLQQAGPTPLQTPWPQSLASWPAWRASVLKFSLPASLSRSSLLGQETKATPLLLTPPPNLHPCSLYFFPSLCSSSPSPSTSMRLLASSPSSAAPPSEPAPSSPSTDRLRCFQVLSSQNHKTAPLLFALCSMNPGGTALPLLPSPSPSHGSQLAVPWFPVGAAPASSLWHLPLSHPEDLRA